MATSIFQAEYNEEGKKNVIFENTAKMIANRAKKEQVEINEFLKVNDRTRVKNIEFVRMQAKLQIIIRTFVSLIFVIILAYGGYLIYVTETYDAASRFTKGELLEFFYLFNLLIWPMMALGRIIQIRSRGKGSLQRIEHILNEPIDIKDAKDIVHVDSIEGKIEFRHVNFKYPKAPENVLSDLNFTISAGETVGILGRTGSGKTSIVDLLLRIYNVEE